MLDCLLACLYLCDVAVPEQAGGVWCAALGAVAVHVLTSTCKVLMPCTCPCTIQTNRLAATHSGPRLELWGLSQCCYVGVHESNTSTQFGAGIAWCYMHVARTP